MDSRAVLIPHMLIFLPFLIYSTESTVYVATHSQEPVQLKLAPKPSQSSPESPVSCEDSSPF